MYWYLSIISSEIFFFPIVGSCHFDSVYLSEQGCEGPWVFCDAKRGPRAKTLLYGEVIVVCSDIHTEHTNTLCGQSVEFFMLNLVVHIVTTRF